MIYNYKEITIFPLQTSKNNKNINVNIIIRYLSNYYIDIEENVYIL